MSAVFKLPVTQVDVLGNNGAGLGDVAIQVGKVFGLTRQGSHVVLGEMIFDTATRPELGGNQNVFKATYIKAYFLQNGAILAPSFLHNVGLWGQGDAPRINLTTVDVYYVPKMADPRNLVTFVAVCTTVRIPLDVSRFTGTAGSARAAFANKL